MLTSEAGRVFIATNVQGRSAAIAGVVILVAAYPSDSEANGARDATPLATHGRTWVFATLVLRIPGAASASHRGGCRLCNRASRCHDRIDACYGQMIERPLGCVFGCGANVRHAARSRRVPSGADQTDALNLSSVLVPPARRQRQRHRIQVESESLARVDHERRVVHLRADGELAGEVDVHAGAGE